MNQRALVPYPLAPVQYFDENTVFDVYINYRSSVNDYRKYLTATSLNAIINKYGHNRARLAIFNLASENNWQNDLTYDLVRLVNDYAQFLFNQYKSKTIVEVIQEAADQAATFITSLIVFNIPELRSIIEPQAEYAARENLQVFAQVNNQLQIYYGEDLQYFKSLIQTKESMVSSAFPGQNFVNQVFVDPNTGMQYVQQVPVAPNYQPGFNPGNQAYQPMPYNQQGFQRPAFQPVNFQNTQTTSPGSQSDAFNSKFSKPVAPAAPNFVVPGQTAPTNVSEPVAENKGFQMPTIKDWKASIDDPYLVLPNILQIQKFDYQKDKVVQVLEYSGDFDTLDLERAAMDRKAHERFFAINQTHQDEIKFKNQSDLIFKVNEAYTQQVRDQEDKMLEIQTVIYPVCYITNSFEEMMQKILCEMEKNDSKVYRLFGIVFDPFYTRYDINGELRRIIGTNNESAAKMIAYMKEQYQGNFDIGTSQAQDYMHKNILIKEYSRLYKKIDQFYTELINDFVQNNLCLKIRIDSFIEDYEDLKNIIGEKYSKLYLHALESFEQKMLKVYSPIRIEDDIEQSIKYNVLFTDEEKYNCNDQVVQVEFIQKAISITAIEGCSNQFFSNEIKANLSENSMLITRKDQPLLYKIVYSLAEQSKELLNGLAQENILIFKDYPQEKYRIYKSYITQDSYLIKKV